MAVEVTRITASLGSSMRGSGTSSTETFSLPCQVSALIRAPVDVRQSHLPGWAVPRTAGSGARNRSRLVHTHDSTALPEAARSPRSYPARHGPTHDHRRPRH